MITTRGGHCPIGFSPIKVLDILGWASMVPELPDLAAPVNPAPVLLPFCEEKN